MTYLMGLDPLILFLGALVVLILFRKLFWLVVGLALLVFMGEEAYGLLFVGLGAYIVFKLGFSRRRAA